MKFIIILAVWFLAHSAQAFNLTATIEKSANMDVRLLGFDGFNEVLLGQDRSDDSGKFSIDYDSYQGGAVLHFINAQKKIFVMLKSPQVTLRGKSISNPAEIIFDEGKFNQLYGAYAKEQRARNSVIPAWKYLLKKYTKSKLLDQEKISQIQHNLDTLKQEKKQASQAFEALPYLDWFVRLRGFIEESPIALERRPEDIPVHIATFKAADLLDDRLWKSGFLDEFFKAYFYLLENSAGGLSVGEKELNLAVDDIADKLRADNAKFQIIMQRTFDLFEKRSLYKPAKYLAKKLLAGDDELGTRFRDKMSIYTTLEQGVRAPEIVLEDGEDFSEINSKYKLVIFIGNNCQTCEGQLNKFKARRDELANFDVQVLVVYKNDTQKRYILPKTWLAISSTKSFRDYHVWKPVSFHLLNADFKVPRLKQPLSVSQLMSWLNQLKRQL